MLGMLVFLQVCVLACFAYPRAYVLASLACLLVLCLYVLTYRIWLLSSNILCTYVLGILVCLIYVTFEKLNSKNCFIEELGFYSEVNLELLLNIYDGVLLRKKLTAKSH